MKKDRLFNLRMTTKELKKLDRIAEATSQTKSEIVRKWIEITDIKSGKISTMHTIYIDHEK